MVIKRDAVLVNDGDLFEQFDFLQVYTFLQQKFLRLTMLGAQYRALGM